MKNLIKIFNIALLLKRQVLSLKLPFILKATNLNFTKNAIFTPAFGSQNNLWQL